MKSVWSCPALGSAGLYLIIGEHVPRSGGEHVAALLDEECAPRTTGSDVSDHLVWVSSLS